MRKVTKAFVTGLAALLPIVITIYFLLWFINLAEGLFGGILKWALPEGWYWRGMGLLLGLVATVLLGIALKMWVVRRVFRWGERLFDRLPVVKIVYGAARDLIGFFSDSKRRSFNEVVLVTVSQQPLIRQLGLVTREEFGGCPPAMAEGDMVAVYFPMSYQLGGPTQLVPRSVIEPIEMSFEEAMRFALTAAMSLETGRDKRT